MRPIGMVLVLPLALPLAALQAQTVAPDFGDRVRIHFTDARTSRVVTGTLLFQDADSVTLLEKVKAGPVMASPRAGPPAIQLIEGRRVSVPRPQISRLEVSTGHSSAGTGALIGAGIGVAGGVALGVASLCSNNDGMFCLDTPGQVVVLAAATGAIGAAIGAIVGLCVHHERWVPAGDGPRASVMLLPSETGGAVGVSIRF
jgi:hypothetical protein